MKLLRLKLSVFLSMALPIFGLFKWVKPGNLSVLIPGVVRNKERDMPVHIFCRRSISDKSNALFLFNISFSSDREDSAAGTAESCTVKDELGINDNDSSYSTIRDACAVEVLEDFLLRIRERRCCWPFLNNSFENSQRPRTIFRNPYITNPINYINTPTFALR